MKPTREWSRAEADDYRDWLLRTLDVRVDGLLCSLDVSPAAPELLRTAGAAVATRLSESEFVHTLGGQTTLTDAGRALAADMGLLTARLLLELGRGRVRWEVMRRPRSDLAFNLPVIVGFRDGNHFDPVGGSIAEACGILAGRRSGDAWAKAYAYWASRIE